MVELENETLAWHFIKRFLKIILKRFVLRSDLKHVTDSAASDLQQGVPGLRGPDCKSPVLSQKGPAWRSDAAHWDVWPRIHLLSALRCMNIYALVLVTGTYCMCSLHLTEWAYTVWMYNHRPSYPVWGGAKRGSKESDSFTWQTFCYLLLVFSLPGHPNIQGIKGVINKTDYRWGKSCLRLLLFFTKILQEHLLGEKMQNRSALHVFWLVIEMWHL